MCFLFPTSPGLQSVHTNTPSQTVRLHLHRTLSIYEELRFVFCWANKAGRNLLSASLQLGQVQAIRRFFSPGWPGSSRVRVWSTWMACWPCVVASWSPPPCIVWTVRCCWPDKHTDRLAVRDTAGLRPERPSSSENPDYRLTATSQTEVKV